LKKIGLILILFTGCAKYQVVQEVKVNMYHLHHPTKGVEIIITKDELKVGNWYRLKQINAIEIDR
tara:strand:- start:416 stop:610 length:195 start_codon:yes stop_codon:yes gene_type:complete